METVKLVSRFMEHALAYRLWQTAFAEKKLAPVLADNDLGAVRRVLDVGCGPGTNTRHFGHVHILELVLPEAPSVARLLTQWDRGDFPRPLAEWRELFTECFQPVVFSPYGLGAFGTTLWNMVYFKGQARRA